MGRWGEIQLITLNFFPFRYDGVQSLWNILCKLTNYYLIFDYLVAVHDFIVFQSNHFEPLRQELISVASSKTQSTSCVFAGCSLGRFTHIRGITIRKEQG